MKRTSLYGLFTFFAIGVALSLGCQKGDDRPATYSVTGTVTHNGTPVEGAIVTFNPTGEGPGASGVTDSSGKYKLSTFGGDDGAIPGEYSVKVVKFEGGAVEAAGGEEPLEEGGVPDAMPEGGGASETKNLLPEKYANPSTSGLKATVKEEDNTIDFTLEG